MRARARARLGKHNDTIVVCGLASVAIGTRPQAKRLGVPASLQGGAQALEKMGAPEMKVSHCHRQQALAMQPPFSSLASRELMAEDKRNRCHGADAETWLRHRRAEPDSEVATPAPAGEDRPILFSLTRSGCRV